MVSRLADQIRSCHPAQLSFENCRSLPSLATILRLLGLSSLPFLLVPWACRREAGRSSGGEHLFICNPSKVAKGRSCMSACIVDLAMSHGIALSIPPAHLSPDQIRSCHPAHTLIRELQESPVSSNNPQIARSIIAAFPACPLGMSQGGWQVFWRRASLHMQPIKGCKRQVLHVGMHSRPGHVTWHRSVYASASRP